MKAKKAKKAQIITKIDNFIIILFKIDSCVICERCTLKTTFVVASYLYNKDNTILVCRLAIWLICAFLRMVWGGGKGEGYSLSVRVST